MFKIERQKAPEHYEEEFFWKGGMVDYADRSFPDHTPFFCV